MSGALLTLEELFELGPPDPPASPSEALSALFPALAAAGTAYLGRLEPESAHVLWRVLRGESDGLEDARVLLAMALSFHAAAKLMTELAGVSERQHFEQIASLEATERKRSS